MERSRLSMKFLAISVFVLLLIGAYIGYVVMDILLAVASPRLSIDSFLITQTMAELYGPLLNKETISAGIVAKFPVAFLLSNIMVLGALYVFWLTSVFDNIRDLWRHNKITVSMISMVILFLHLLLLVSYLIGIDKLFGVEVNHRVTASSMGLYFLFSLLVFGLLSYIAELIRKDGSLRSVDHKTVFMHAVLASVLSIAAQYFIINDFDSFLASLNVIWGPGEGTVAGWHRIYMIMIFFCVSIFTLTGSLIIYILKPKSLHNKIVPLMILGTAVISGQLFSNYLNTTLDLRYESLNKAAGLTVLKTQPPAKSFLLFNDNLESDKNNTAIIEWKRRVDTVGYANDLKESVDLVEENVENLKKYIQKDVHTHYTSVAVDALMDIKKLDLDMQGYREVALESMYKGGTFLNAMSLTMTLTNNIPVTEDNLQFLKTLSNEDDFYIAGDNAYILSKLWISFGDEKRAKTLYDKAITTSTLEYSWYDSWDEILQKHRFNKGKISGKITGLDQPTQVALVDCSSSEKKRSLSFHKIKAVTTTTDNGDFVFDNLVKGEYTLAVVIPESKKLVDKPKEVVHISISEETPESDDITITLSVNK